MSEPRGLGHEGWALATTVDAAGQRSGRWSEATGLRIAALVVEPIAYRLVAAWAERAGHRIALLVTTPGPPRSRANRDYLDLVAAVPPGQDVLISTRMRRTVAPALAVVAPDLLVSFTFPHRIPAEMVALPRFGAVNLHPTPLPAYRGPNPRRMLFDERPTLGAALHRIEAGFDAGAILACHERPLPAEPTPERVLELWLTVLAEALEAGARRALAGEWGKAQDESAATYAAPFTAEERLLDWRWPAAKLAQRALALSLFRPEAVGTIAGEPVAIRRVTVRRGPSPEVGPGTILERDGDRVVVAVGDGAVEVVTAGPPVAATTERPAVELGIG